MGLLYGPATLPTNSWPILDILQPKRELSQYLPGSTNILDDSKMIQEKLLHIRLKKKKSHQTFIFIDREKKEIEDSSIFDNEASK